MKNIFGNALTITLFGESHAGEIGVVIDGMTPGVEVSEDFIRSQLTLRRPAGQISTSRQEADEFRIVSGLFNGVTTGTPLTILIPNTDQRSRDYEKTRYIARPGHADYTAEVKYHGHQDYRGGGHFSGRITAALVAAGAVLIPALRKKGILIGSHIQRLGSVSDAGFSQDPFALRMEIQQVNDRLFAVIDDEKEDEMKSEILIAKEHGDSVGGILETAVSGLPAGLGEPWFDSVESELSHILFSVPAVKGVEFGDGFAGVTGYGSSFNDAFRIDEDGRVYTLTNHNGGVNGGITNGMPVLFRTAVKPTPSIHRKQDTIDFGNSENTVLDLEGRHDPAIIHRARVVVDSVAAIAVADMLIERYGTDYFTQPADHIQIAHERMPAMPEGGNGELNIVLTGMSGAGKTAIGRVLAEFTGRRYVDLDEEIIRRAGMSVNDIFAKYGEKGFRDLESDVITDVGREKGIIISTGGGAVLREQNVRALKENGRIIFLDRDVSSILPTDDRPLANSIDKIITLYRERYPIYLNAADIQIKVFGTPKDTAKELLRRMRMEGDY